MTAAELCEQLIERSDGPERETLIQEAVALPEALNYLLDTGLQHMGADAGQALLRANLATLLADRRQDRRGEAEAWRLTAQVYRVQGNHAGALDASETAAIRAIQAGDMRLAAQVQIGRIDSLGWMGRYDEAFALARRLEAELRNYGEVSDAAKVLVNMGALHYRRDQYPLALSCYERATEALQSDVVAQAKVQANMAAVLMELHRVDEAIPLFEKARTVFAAQGLSTPAAMVDANIGFLHYLSGRYVQAIASLQRAREEFAQRGQELEIAKSDADMAEAYRELDLYPEALETYERAIQAMESRGIDYERARAEMGRASVWLSLDRHEDAAAGLERAAVLFRAHRNVTQQARVRLLQSHILRRDGQTVAARQEAQHAAATLKRKGLRGWAAEARFLLAEMDLEAGQNVSRTLHAISRTAQASARGWLQCRAQQALGQLYLERGDRARGLRYLRASVQTLEQARTLIAPEEMHISFLRNKLPIYEALIGALLARGRQKDIAEALEYVERAKSRLLLERVQTSLEGRIAGNVLPVALVERLAQLRAELSRGYHRLNAVDENEARRIGPAGTEDLVALTGLEQEYRAALQQAEFRAGKISGGFALPPIVSALDLQQAINDSETLLEYYIVGGTICAWIVTSQGMHFKSDIASLEEVNHVARRLRYQLQRDCGISEFSQRHSQRFQADIQVVLKQLYDLLLRPLEPLLATDQITLVPHGVLHGLPFHAFFDGAQYALDRWQFVSTPSAALWHAGALRRQSQQAEQAPFVSGDALLVGVPSPGIEQVVQEVAQLAALLPHARVLTQEAATLDAFKQHAGGCRLLHLATHALYRTDNPLFSGLQMADGWLLARDLYERALNCELATLSACQTGMASVEAGDEIFGLVRGFLAAGARSVAASLWPANDQATAFLMKHFYTLWTQGASKAEALRSAQKRTRSQFPHPYHWAAFVLIGER